MSPLTESQQATLEFIRSYIQEYRFSPTISEIAQGMGWASANNAYIKVKALEKKGCITMRQGISRSIALCEERSSFIPPPGWKLVPVEPTPKQWAAGLKAMDGGIDKVTLAYQVMVNAAPGGDE